MDSEKYVFIAVKDETRTILRRLAQHRRTKIYQLVQTLAEKDLKNFLPSEVNIDSPNEKEPSHA